MDVLCELEFAARIAKFVTELRYQVPTPSGKNIDFLVGFQNSCNVGVEIKRIREIPIPTTRNEEGLDEINYTQRESFKFTDHIMVAMSQLLPEIPNVVFVKIDSTTHEFHDAGLAINSIVRRVRHNDLDFLQRHKFDSRDQFLEHYKRMNLLMVRSKWGPSISSAGMNFNSNRIWINGDATGELAEPVVDVFRRVSNSF